MILQTKQPKTWTAKDLAEFFNISLRGAYNLMYANGFPAFRLGRRILVDYDAFMQWYEQHIKESGDNKFSYFHLLSGTGNRTR